MKLLIMPRSIDQAVSLIEHIDGMIVGLKNMSVNMPSYYSYDEIVRFVNIAKKFNKEIFVSLNKNMFNSSLNIIVVARAGAAKKGFKEIESAFLHLLKLHGVLTEGEVSKDANN